jgi:hypothetical protein
VDQTLGEAKRTVSKPQPATRIRLLKWTSKRQGPLRGFADLQLPNSLRVYGCPVLFSHGRAWVTFPARPQIGRDGHVIKVDGKRQYASCIEWSDRATADRFSAVVVALVRTQEPDAFAGDQFSVNQTP